MRITQTIAVLGLFAAAITVACSDSGPLQPEALKKTLAAGSTAGGTDTAGHTPRDTSHNNPPDTVGTGQANFDPRTIVGTVSGMGAGPDSENVKPVAGATVVLSTLPDTVAGTPGKELGRAVSKTDGTFTLPGTYKPGLYQMDVTPPAGSPFRASHHFVGFGPWSPPTVTLDVWLPRQ